MFRGTQRDYPVSPKLRQRPLPSSGGRRFFSSRARLHPVVLVPVFLCGCLLAPWFTDYLSPHGPRLPEPVYNPEEYRWRSGAFAPADAPPLVADEYGSAQRGGEGAARRAVAEAAAAHKKDEQEWDWWEPSAEDSTSLADLTSSLYTVHAGLLYFRTSPALIPRQILSKPFPVAPARLPRPAPLPRQPDQGLTLPPHAPKDWLLPGEVFVHSPGHRRHALVSAGSLETRNQPVPLHAPLPAAPKRANPVEAERARLNAGRSRGKIERDAQGKVLGPNAAAMARAKREGRPFVPGKPAELLEEERKLQKARAHAQAIQDNKKGVKWQAAPAQGPVQPIIAQGHAIVDDEDEDIVAPFEDEESDAMWRGGGADRAQEQAALQNAAAGLAADADDEEDDDVALLEAVRALSPDELELLTPDERQLVADLEAKEAAQKAAAANEPPKPVRRTWRELTDHAAPVDDEALRKARALREERRKNPPRAPMPKPVFKGEAGRLADKQRREGGALRKRALEFEEPVEAGEAATVQPVIEDPPARKLRKRAVVVEAPVEEPAQEPVILSATSSPNTDPDPSAPPSAALNRRAAVPENPSSTLPDRLHPISHLIARAEEQWDDMLRRQSQTLDQAVEEYRRRYKMNPPVGFDSWWRYAMQNRVVLVDEYDQIHADILPFLSLPPSEFRRRVMSLSTDQSLPWYRQSFQLKVHDGSVVVGQGGSEATERRDDILDLLAEFSEMLPDLEVRLGKGDEPMVVISGEARERHEQLAQDGKLLGISPSYEIFEPSGFTPWDSLCPPNSTARRVAQALPVDTPRSNSLKSFLSVEHSQAMDVCEHPEIRELNGFTAWSGPRPYLLYPLFSFAKTSVHADLLLPAISSDYFTEVGRDPVWEQKKVNKVLWRGETTGSYHSKGSGWRQTQRARLVALANAKSGESTFHLADSTSDALCLASGPAKDVSAFYYDVAYTGAPKQCSTKDTTCKQLQHEFRFDRWLSADEENKYKYVLDVDANYASGRFKRLMSSRSLVLKSTIFPEWWSKRIMPWYHYIPIQSDYSDLTDVAAFFIGAPDGTGAHDSTAKRIAAQGKNWSEEHYREADMAAYIFRLLLEYARLLHRDEDDLQSMDYNP
ncbi:hypothetical protein JCM10450v2_004189 [Rhodotorula kratochvilovae]